MKRNIGLVLLGLASITILANSFFIKEELANGILSFSAILALVAGFLLIIPFELFSMVIFDTRDWSKNKSIDELVGKFRLRALLFNNLSVGILATTILVIVAGFYLLVNPPIANGTDIPINLTVRIGASVLLIFLVQILFKVFKYLLRVAAFYNAKADAIEFNQFKPEVDLVKLMELLTPEKYDITDLQQTSISDSVVESIKAKLGK